MLRHLFWFMRQSRRISWTCGVWNKQCKFRQRSNELVWKIVVSGRWDWNVASVVLIRAMGPASRSPALLGLKGKWFRFEKEKFFGLKEKSLLSLCPPTPQKLEHILKIQSFYGFLYLILFLPVARVVHGTFLDFFRKFSLTVNSTRMGPRLGLQVP